MNPTTKAVGELGVMKNNGAKNSQDRGGNGCWAVPVGSLREEQKPMVTHVMGGGLPQVAISQPRPVPGKPVPITHTGFSDL
jgi:hypothetical protein